MPNCQSCGSYIHTEGYCIKCGVSAMKKRKEKAKSEFKKKKTSELDNLIKRADDLFSKIIRSKYDKSGFSNCCTCMKPIRTFGGVFGGHCGHLYPKFKYWAFRWDLRNAATQCYDCNTNNEGEQLKMFDYLVTVFGEFEMQKLKDEAEKFVLKLNVGALTKKPPIEFVKSEIERLKKIT